MLTIARTTLEVARAIQVDVDELTGPPSEGERPRTNVVVDFALVRKTRGYHERVVNQINGAYEHGWYDACAVMIRRLVETLIIEAFENHGIAQKIKNSNGDYKYLSDLITCTLNEPTFNLGRKAKTALPRLKDIGDQSAHSRRYVANRADIESLRLDIRTVVQELVFLAGLK